MLNISLLDLWQFLLELLIWFATADLLQVSERFEEEADGTDQEAAEGGMQFCCFYFFVPSLSLVLFIYLFKKTHQFCSMNASLC